MLETFCFRKIYARCRESYWLRLAGFLGHVRTAEQIAYNASSYGFGSGTPSDEDRDMDTAERGAAVAIVRACTPSESILLMRRSERKEDSWSGHWSFPGGRRDPGDPDLLHTALRELEEECGIRLDREQMETALPPVLARRRTGPFVLVAPFVFGVDTELPTAVDHREAVEAVWVPQSGWRDPARHSLRTVPFRPGNLLFPAFDLNGTPVWGFTYRVVTNWLGLMPEQAEPGFEVACLVLEFLLAHGLKLKRGWEERAAQSWTEERITAKFAEVEGAIPVALVTAEFAASGEDFPRVNLLEILPEKIRIVGLAFEEYVISAAV
jgi:8-oxo-dGTP pyrophosphatase MutT (NUDIX family)